MNPRMVILFTAIVSFFCAQKYSFASNTIAKRTSYNYDYNYNEVELRVEDDGNIFRKFNTDSFRKDVFLHSCLSEEWDEVQKVMRDFQNSKKEGQVNLPISDHLPFGMKG